MKMKGDRNRISGYHPIWRSVPNFERKREREGGIEQSDSGRIRRACLRHIVYHPLILPSVFSKGRQLYLLIPFPIYLHQFDRRHKR